MENVKYQRVFLNLNQLTGPGVSAVKLRAVKTVHD